MAYLAAEKWGCNYDDHNEVPEIDNIDIFISLLDESQVEYYDDERLKSLIQFLEAEIDPIAMDDHGVLEQPTVDGYLEDHLSCGGEQLNSQHSIASDNLELDWMDMEMDASSSSPSDEMSSWSVQGCADDSFDMTEFEKVHDDYPQICYAVPFEDHFCSSFWQETQEPVMLG